MARRTRGMGQDIEARGGGTALVAQSVSDSLSGVAGVSGLQRSITETVGGNSAGLHNPNAPVDGRHGGETSANSTLMQQVYRPVDVLGGNVSASSLSVNHAVAVQSSIADEVTTHDVVAVQSIVAVVTPVSVAAPVLPPVFVPPPVVVPVAPVAPPVTPVTPPVPPEPPVVLPPVNHAPTVSATASAVSDAATAGAVLAAVSVSDQDVDAVSLSLTGADADKAAIVGNHVVAAVPLLGMSDLHITVRATDSHGATADVAVTVPVLPQAPSVVALSNSTISALAGSGAAVAVLTVTDVEQGAHAYSLSGADAALFVVDAAGHVFTAGNLDFGTRHITVTATNSATGLAVAHDFVVTVDALAPTSITLPTTAATACAAGTVLSAVQIADPEAGAHTLALSGADANKLAIDGSGNVVSATALSAGMLEFDLTATNAADGKSITQHFVYTVNPVPNSAPTAPTLSHSAVDENSASGTVIGHLSATDPDGDSLTFSIVGGADAAAVAVSGSDLVTTVFLDHEAQSSLTVVVRADDGHGHHADRTFAIAVNDVNEAPAVTWSSVGVVQDTVASGTVLGSVSVSDPDAGDTATYSVSGRDAAKVVVDASGTVRTAAAILGMAELDFTVTATDSHGATGSVAAVQHASIQAPSAVVLTPTALAALSGAGAAVGTLAATDVEAGTHVFSLSGQDAAKFIVDASGNLTTAADLDHGAYSITVTATNQTTGLSSAHAFTVNVSAIAPDSVAMSGGTIAALGGVGVQVGSVAVTDREAGSHVYSLSGQDAGKFSIDAIGVITSSVNLDHGAYSLTVTATNTSTGLSISHAENVTVTALSPSAVTLSNASIAALSGAGAVVGSLSTVDLESGAHTYSLSGHDATSFSVDGSGRLITAADLDHGSFDLVVTATNAVTGLSVSHAVTITVNALAPSAVALDNAEINALMPSGTVVGTLSTVDPEAGAHTLSILPAGDGADFSVDGQGRLVSSGSLDHGVYHLTVRSENDATHQHVDTVLAVTVDAVAPTSVALGNTTIAALAGTGAAVGTAAVVDPESGQHTFALSGADASKFAVDGSGNVTTAQNLDYGVYHLTVTATNSTTGLAVSHVEVVTVSPLAPTAVVLSNAAISALLASGSTIGALGTTDAEGGAHNYSILPGNDNADFSIVGGNLVTVGSLDYGSYHLTVRSLNTVTGQHVDTTLTVVVDAVAPTAIAMSNTTLAALAGAGAAVGVAAVTDSESGQHAYSLSGHDAGLFAVDASGHVTTVGNLDYGTYALTVTATNTATGLSVSHAETITVTPLAPTAVSIGNTTIAALSGAGAVIGALSMTDAEAGTAAYSLSGADAGKFSVDGSGRLVSAVDLDHGTYALTLTATNQTTGLSVSHSMTVTVTAIAPDAVSMSGGEIAALGGVGVAIGTVSTSDRESGQHSYSLGGADAAKFAVDASGNVTTSQNLDWGTYSLTVTATNQTTVLAVSHAETVVVDALAPTVLSLSANEISALAGNGIVIGALSTVDPEAGAHTITLSGQDAALFAVSNGNLVTAGNLDWGVYHLTATSTNATTSLAVSQALTVTVDALAPTAVTLTKSTLAALSGSGAAVGAASVTDSESGQHSYALGGADAAKFAVDASGNVTTVQDLDYGVYHLTVTATNTNTGLAVSHAETITVSALAPTSVSLSNSTLTALSGNAAVIGVLSTSDPEAGPHSYSLSGQDAGKFSVDGQGRLVTAQDLDYGDYHLTVTTTNTTTGLAVSHAEVVTVAPLAPSSVSLSNAEIAALAGNGAVVGNLSTVDLEPGSHTYSLVAGQDAASFALSGSSLVTSGNLDYGTYHVTVRSTSDTTGRHTDHTFTIGVDALAPTAVTLTNSTIAALQPDGTVIGGLGTTDQEAGSHTLSIVGGADAASFAITGGNLVTVGSLDFGSYHVTVRSVNDVTGQHVDTTMTVNIDAVSPTAVSLSNSTIAALSGDAAVVGALSTTDTEAGAHTYSVGGVDAGKFAVSNGNLVTIGSLDYGSYSVTVTSMNTVTGKSFAQAETITVSALSPSDVTLSNSSIDAQSGSGAIIGTLGTVDQESGAHTYALSGDDAASFAVDGSGRLVTASDLAAGTYHVTVTGLNTATGLTASHAETIVIRPLAPTDLTLTGSLVALAGSGAAAGTIGTVDAAAGAHTYAITGGASSGLFAIDANTGALTTTSNLDYGTYGITVRTTNTTTGLSFEKAESIVVAPLAPTSVALSGTGTFASTAASGYVLGALSTVDPEAGSHTYSVVGANSASFAVSGGNLVLAASNLAAGNYNVTVRTTNDADGAYLDQVLTVVSQAPHTNGATLAVATVSPGGVAYDNNNLANITHTQDYWCDGSVGPGAISHPLSGMVVADQNPGANVTVRISLSDTLGHAASIGTLSGAGVVDQGGGVYSITGDVATVNRELTAAAFTASYVAYYDNGWDWTNNSMMMQYSTSSIYKFSMTVGDGGTNDFGVTTDAFQRFQDTQTLSNGEWRSINNQMLNDIDMQQNGWLRASFTNVVHNLSNIIYMEWIEDGANPAEHADILAITGTVANGTTGTTNLYSYNYPTPSVLDVSSTAVLNRVVDNHDVGRHFVNIEPGATGTFTVIDSGTAANAGNYVNYTTNYFKIDASSTLTVNLPYSFGTQIDMRNVLPANMFDAAHIRLSGTDSNDLQLQVNTGSGWTSVMHVTNLGNFFNKTNDPWVSGAVTQGQLDAEVASWFSRTPGGGHGYDDFPYTNPLVYTAPITLTAGTTAYSITDSQNAQVFMGTSVPTPALVDSAATGHYTGTPTAFEMVHATITAPDSGILNAVQWTIGSDVGGTVTYTFDGTIEQLNGSLTTAKWTPISGATGLEAVDEVLHLTVTKQYYTTTMLTEDVTVHVTPANPSYVGHSGADAVTISHTVTNATVDMFDANSGDILHLAQGANSFSHLNNLSHVFGTAGNDTLTILAASNPIGAGGQTIHLGGGTDTLNIGNTDEANILVRLTVNTDGGNVTIKSGEFLNSSLAPSIVGFDDTKDAFNLSRTLTAGNVDSSHVRLIAEDGTDRDVDLQVNSGSGWHTEAVIHGGTSSDGTLHGGDGHAVSQAQLDTLRDSWIAHSTLHA